MDPIDHGDEHDLLSSIPVSEVIASACGHVLMRHGLGSGLSMSRLKQMLIVVKQPLASVFNTISAESTRHTDNIPE